MLELTLVILAIIIIMAIVTSVTDVFDTLAYALLFILFIPGIICGIWVIYNILVHGFYILCIVGVVAIVLFFTIKQNIKNSQSNNNNQKQTENTMTEKHEYLISKTRFQLATEEFDSKYFTDGHIAMLRIAKQNNYNIKGLMNCMEPIYSLILFNYYTSITKPNRLSVEDIYLFCSIHPFEYEKKEMELKDFFDRDSYGFNNYETKLVRYKRDLESIEDDVNITDKYYSPFDINININTTDSKEFIKLESAILNKYFIHHDRYAYDGWINSNGDKIFNNKFSGLTYSSILALINDMNIEIKQFIYGDLNSTSLSINEIGPKIKKFIEKEESMKKSIKDANERRKAINYIQSN